MAADTCEYVPLWGWSFIDRNQRIVGFWRPNKKKKKFYSNELESDISA
jgi:hypothetical protein